MAANSQEESQRYIKMTNEIIAARIKLENSKKDLEKAYQNISSGFTSANNQTQKQVNNIQNVITQMNIKISELNKLELDSINNSK